MAYINNYWIFVKEENVSRGITVSSHPVEDGLEISDNIKRSPVSIQLTGQIVGENAATILSNINALHQGGKYVKYSGRNIMKNAIIESFETGHPNTIAGGCSFSMTLKEIRIAKSAYVAPVATNTTTTATVVKETTKSGTQQVQSNTATKTHTVKKGDSLWAIAKSYYGNGSQYTKIVEANKDKLGTGNAIHPGMVLVIP